MIYWHKYTRCHFTICYFVSNLFPGVNSNWLQTEIWEQKFLLYQCIEVIYYRIYMWFWSWVGTFIIHIWGQIVYQKKLQAVSDYNYETLKSILKLKMTLNFAPEQFISCNRKENWDSASKTIESYWRKHFSL